MDYTEVDEAINKANQELKRRGNRVTIERRRDALYGRGTFPDKSGVGRPSRQYVSLKLSARVHNLNAATKAVMELSMALEFGTFTWAIAARQVDSVSIAAWVDKLQQRYFETRLNTPDTQQNWKKDYGYVLAYLPQSVPPSVAVCKDLITSRYPITTGSPKGRNRAVMACSQLLELAGIDASELRRLKATDRINPIRKRDIPDLETIVAWRLQVPDRWRDAYSIAALYGIRPSEIWQLDLSELAIDKTLIVDSSKTNDVRFVYPYPEYLFDEFELGRPIKIPTSEALALKTKSQTFARMLARARCPFSPYKLRHQYAFQLSLAGEDLQWQCDMMGHSPTVHTAYYKLFMKDLASVRKLRQANRDIGSNRFLKT